MPNKVLSEFMSPPKERDYGNTTFRRWKKTPFAYCTLATAGSWLERKFLNCSVFSVGLFPAAEWNCETKVLMAFSRSDSCGGRRTLRLCKPHRNNGPSNEHNKHYPYLLSLGFYRIVRLSAAFKVYYKNTSWTDLLVLSSILINCDTISHWQKHAAPHSRCCLVTRDAIELRNREREQNIGPRSHAGSHLTAWLPQWFRRRRCLRIECRRPLQRLLFVFRACARPREAPGG